MKAEKLQECLARMDEFEHKRAEVVVIGDYDRKGYEMPALSVELREGGLKVVIEVDLDDISCELAGDVEKAAVEKGRAFEKKNRHKETVKVLKRFVAMNMEKMSGILAGYSPTMEAEEIEKRELALFRLIEKCITEQ
jgi:hypothetical protein